MDKLSGAEIDRIPTENLKNITARIVECEVDEDDNTVEMANKVKGLELKNELSGIVRGSGRMMTPKQIETELIKLGLKDEQYYMRIRIKKILEDHLAGL